MAWLKVDDGFWSHPKVISLSSDAVALWVRAGSYCAQHLTDGDVPSAVVALLGGNEAAATELVQAGLWDSKSDGYAFHDWANYQPSSADTKARRDETSRKRAEAGRKGAASRWGTADGNEDGNLPSGSNGNDMAPSRPVPSPSSKEEDTPITGPAAKAPLPRKPPYSEDFLKFWGMGLRKDDKMSAWRAWEKIRKAGMLPTLDVLQSAVSDYLTHNPEKKFQKYVATWLNAAAWENEYDDSPGQHEPARRDAVPAWMKGDD